MTAVAANPNLARLAAVSKKLEPLLDQLAFVGGIVTGLLVTDPGAAPVRPTLDVDAIVEVASCADFTVLEARLRSLSFHESHAESAPICRWIHGDLILDLLPTDPSILGFSNRWYRAALQNARPLTIEALTIRIITAPYFLATKLDAFHGRGKEDYRLSRDLEDIMTVIDGRPELVAEVAAADDAVRQYLSAELAAMLENRDFVEALPGHLLPDAASQQRIGIVVDRIRKIIAKG